MIFDCEIVKITVIHTQVKIILRFFNKDDRESCKRRTDTNKVLN